MFKFGIKPVRHLRELANFLSDFQATVTAKNTIGEKQGQKTHN